MISCACRLYVFGTIYREFRQSSILRINAEEEEEEEEEGEEEKKIKL